MFGGVTDSGELRRADVRLLNVIRVAQVATSLIAIAALTLTVVHLGDTNRIVLRNCRNVELVKTALRQVIYESVRTLGRPGTAGYAYYRQHPADVQLAKTAAAVQIRIFKPVSCRA